MKEHPPQIPKDLGLKIGSPIEVLWTNVRDNAKRDLDSAKNEVIVSTEIMHMAETKIAFEKEANRKI